MSVCGEGGEGGGEREVSHVMCDSVYVYLPLVVPGVQGWRTARREGGVSGYHSAGQTVSSSL